MPDPTNVPAKENRTTDIPPIAANGQSFIIQERKRPDYLHVHYADDEAWHVLEGTLTFKFRHREVEAPAGTTVFVPAGAPHAYYEAHRPTRYLIILTPRLLALISALHATPFAALGADVTLLDASPQQLAQDRYVAERDNLTIRLVEGDMADLSAFEDASFGLIFNPPSTLFVPDLIPIWRECYRVLQPGGVLMTGFMNPDEFIFDVDALDNEGALVVKYPLPYVEHETLDPEALERRIQQKGMLHFSHTMETQLGGLTQAGFVITGFYEDRRPEADGNPIRHFMPSYFMARALKLA